MKYHSNKRKPADYLVEFIIGFVVGQVLTIVIYSMFRG